MNGLSVEDRLDLAELAARYAVSVDQHDWDGAADLFARRALTLMIVEARPVALVLPFGPAEGR